MITGRLCMSGYGGNTETVVEVIGQTPKRLRIRALTRTRLSGMNRWLQPGESALVPTRAVRDNCVVCHGRCGGVPGNENIINGQVVCDYCAAALLAPEGEQG